MSVWRLLVLAGLFAYFFWVFNPANNVDGLFQEGPFISLFDCDTTRQWVIKSQPTPVASPSPGPTPVPGLIVSPACVQMFNGSANN